MISRGPALGSATLGSRLLAASWLSVALWCVTLGATSCGKTESRPAAAPRVLEVTDANGEGPVGGAFVWVYSRSDASVWIFHDTDFGPSDLFRTDDAGRIVVPGTMTAHDRLDFHLWKPGSEVQRSQCHRQPGATDVFSCGDPPVLITPDDPALAIELPRVPSEDLVAQRKVLDIVRKKLRAEVVASDDSLRVAFAAAAEESIREFERAAGGNDQQVRNDERARSTVTVVVSSDSGEAIEGAFGLMTTSTRVSTTTGDTTELGPVSLVLTGADASFQIPAELNRYGNLRLTVWARDHRRDTQRRRGEEWNHSGPLPDPDRVEVVLKRESSEMNEAERSGAASSRAAVKKAILTQRERVQSGVIGEHPQSLLFDRAVDRWLETEIASQPPSTENLTETSGRLRRSE